MGSSPTSGTSLDKGRNPSPPIRSFFSRFRLTPYPTPYRKGSREKGKGEGSVLKRKDGRWQARYTANGKRRYVYGKTKSEVARRLNEALHEVNRGLVYDDKGMTVGEHLGNCLDASKGSMRMSTWERYEQICRKHIVPELGHLRMRNLTPVAIQDLYRKKLKTLSPRTVQYVHVTLHRSLSLALR